ncbi:MAG: DUF819 family protein [Bacteroidales bacterium]|nr:DUF819 family protein [Bacteroidales bacterium]
MSPVLIVIWVLFYLLAPVGVIWLCRRSAAAGKVGAILILYFLGIIVANLLIYPFEGAAEALFPVQDTLSSLTIPLALPLILFACDFRGWGAKTALKSLIIGLVAVCVATVGAYFLLREHLSPAIAGMAVGVYTGGTPNLAAIKMMLKVDEATYVLMNSFDMLVSFIYLTFLLAVGIRLARKILPFKPGQGAGTGMPLEGGEPGLAPDGAGPATAMSRGEAEMYRGVFSRAHFGGVLKAVGLAIVIAGAAIGVSFLITGGINMIALILTLTTLSIGASFIPAVRKWDKSYDCGMYLVLVFSLVVASMVDVRRLALGEGVWLLAFIALVIFGSLLLQILLGRALKVDADTAVITSVAMINSPLFVPMIAEAMKNRRVILTGITIGIIGYAAGNYLGVLIASLLG